MSVRPQDLWDVLGNLQNASTADTPDADTSLLTDLQSPPADVALVTVSSLTQINVGHSGVYKWNDASSFWNLAQWG